MKKIWKLFFAISLFTLMLFIDTWNAQEDHDTNMFCNQNYEIAWLEWVRIDKTAEYKIILSGTEQTMDNNQIKFVLNYKNKNIVSSKWNKFWYLFKASWEYILKAEFTDDNNCYYSIQKNIKTYWKSIAYIWENIKEFEIWFQDNFQKHDILLNKIIIENKKIIWEDSIITKLSENILDIKNADIVVINSKLFDQILDSLGKINNWQDLELNKKQVFVLNDLNQNFLKRIMAKYIKILWISKVYVLDNNYSLAFFSSLSFDKNVISETYVKTFSLSFDQVPKYFLLSYFVDNLIYNGFPINLIWLFFALWLAALLVSIFRQVIWFSVFGIYSPIFFATSMAVFGLRFSIVVFIIAIIAVILTRLFTKKIYLLYSAKLTVLLILYFLMIVLILWLDKILNINMIDFSMFNNWLVIFPIIFLIVVADKVFYEWFRIKSKTWIISFIEFLIVSGVVYGVLSRDWLKQLLLSYPEFIILIFILNILVGRFTGLQLLEYFRFIPLLEKESDSEIEEE